ncbi:hypothetical protein L1987_48443 [Smallanthus sonchifolius]|uniref:Uncharacterized protein n=1 Tax=Smallanthus sonchifolius TaxID=185202 RepID=A0ACB9FRB9_9ASTR|nr:hypothetical protein L1987_48443 [Smallanthus sonchifolius]
MIGLTCKNFGLVQEIGAAYLSSTQEGRPAYLPTTQEKDHAYLPSTQEKDHAYIPSTQEKDHAYLPSTQEKDHAYLSSAHEQGPAHLLSAQTTDQKLGTMAGGGRTGRRGGRTGRVGRPPLNQRHEEEESVHVEHTESVYETEVTPTGNDDQGPLQVEPDVRDAIACEVVLTLKKVLPDLLSEELKKSREEDEGYHEEKVYDSDGDEVKVGSRNRGCTYKGFKDGATPKFDGNKDSVGTFGWIERMNAVVNISECRPDQAVKYVAHSFTNEALSWWRNIQRTKSPNALARMTWEDLKKLTWEE